jgi:single-strand DNA-binding protein
MVNMWQGIGRIGKEPEARRSGEGSAITSFSLACSEKFKTKSGEQKEETFWAKCVAFGRLAEIVAEYCQKGSLIYISGKLQERKWQDKDGNDRYTTEVIVREMKLLGGRGEDRQSQVQHPPMGTDEDLPF